MKSTLRAIYTCGEISITMDTEQIVPHDPGQGTPVMVHIKPKTGGRESGTWFAVSDTGETADGYQLTPNQLAFIEKSAPAVEAWMAKYGV